MKHGSVEAFTRLWSAPWTTWACGPVKMQRPAGNPLHPYSTRTASMFNLTPDFFTGSFLPPRQTGQGLETYARAIGRLRDGLGVPLAVETGVNYLRPRADEVPDGEFFGAVVETTDCGTLLDLHNVYCNEKNGRQTIDRFLSQIPLERVWEVHLAGASNSTDSGSTLIRARFPHRSKPSAARSFPRCRTSRPSCSKSSRHFSRALVWTRHGASSRSATSCGRCGRPIAAPGEARRCP